MRSSHRRDRGRWASVTPSIQTLSGATNPTTLGQFRKNHSHTLDGRVCFSLFNQFSENGSRRRSADVILNDSIDFKLRPRQPVYRNGAHIGTSSFLAIISSEAMICPWRYSLKVSKVAWSKGRASMSKLMILWKGFLAFTDFGRDITPVILA